MWRPVPTPGTQLGLIRLGLILLEGIIAAKFRNLFDNNCKDSTNMNAAFLGDCLLGDLTPFPKLGFIPRDQ